MKISKKIVFSLLCFILLLTASTLVQAASLKVDCKPMPIGKETTVQVGIGSTGEVVYKLVLTKDDSLTFMFNSEIANGFIDLYDEQESQVPLIAGDNVEYIENTGLMKAGTYQGIYYKRNENAGVFDGGFVV